MSTRHRARELILKALYAYETAGEDPARVMEMIIDSSTLDDKSLQFAQRLFRTTLENLQAIDLEIERHSLNWDLSRLAVVDRNILRIAICELFHFPDIPSKVSIDEAIELAKRYSTLESSAFVNGVLNAVFQEHRVEFER